jgi:2-isopropylmalate synthase
MKSKECEKDKVFIFDTTLRDGEQAAPASLSVNQKLDIARQLARLGVDVIEAGFPISSPGDFQSVSAIAKEFKGGGPIVCGLARLVEKDIERCAQAVSYAKRSRIHVFVGTSAIHAEKKLRKSEDEVLDMIKHHVKYATNLCRGKDGRDVEFSAEDAGRTEKDYLCRVVEAAIAAGATTINIPDTVGYTTPEQFGGIIEMLKNRVPNIGKAVISVHCHNDLGMATANSLTAIAHGARQVECTINGIGERAGNAALEEIVMAIKLRKDFFKAYTGIKTEEIMRTSKLVREICNMPVQPNKAIVGKNAFAHSSGIHQDGVLKSRDTYEIMTPESVGVMGNEMNLTGRSGRNMVKARLASIGYNVGNNDYMAIIYDKYKELADKKGTIYDEDLVTLMKSLDKHDVKDIYTLDYLCVLSGKGEIKPTANVHIAINGKELRKETAEGDGAFSAVKGAIDKVVGYNTEIEEFHIDAVTKGSLAQGQTTIRVSSDEGTFVGIGISTDIVEAAANAYMDIVNKIARTKEYNRKAKKNNGKAV